ncbi:histidine kinase [Tieghemostelium lacteum]|uniref:Histidine kinase n=1 Tax=Tieghemostelium lacteum TaxID=361077 RepID=A0A151ZDN5_TIELA|nr:histidine kinase [Tieghemostelium lacteum]|eukprot:KYQ92057.1 histidine kinase [Tieghemostelium lacteum]
MLYLEILKKLSTAVWLFDIENKQLVWGNPAAAQLWDASSIEQLLMRDFSSDMSLATEIRLKGYLEEFKLGLSKIQNWTFYPNGKGPLPVIIKSSGIMVSLQETIELGLKEVSSRFYTLGIEPPQERMLMMVEAFSDQKGFESEKNKDLLRSIEALRHTPVMISYFDASDSSGNILIQNPSSLEVFGNSIHFKDMFVYPQESEFVYNRLVHEENGGVYRGDLLMKTLNGNQWHRIDARLSRDPVTGNKGIVISHSNIHELRIYQEILEENEKRLQEAQEIANLGSWEWDLIEKSTKVSKQLFRIFGIDPHEIDVGMNFPELVKDLEAVDILPLIFKAIESKSSFEFSHRIKRKNDDSFRILHVKGEVLLNNESLPIRVLGISHDITDIQMAREKIEEESKFVEALIGCLKAGIVACNSKGDLTHFNKAAQSLHGLELSEKTNRVDLFSKILTCYKKDPVMSAEDLEITKLNLEEGKEEEDNEVKSNIPILRALRGETIIDDEISITPYGSPENQEHVVLASGQEIVTKDGKSVGAVIVLHDITERKHVEEELRKATETAQHANQIKSEFLANISHEILSPMNSILGLVALCLDNHLPKNIKDNLEDVFDSSQNLLILLQQILDFNNLESHRLIFKPNQFKLRTTLYSILQLFYRRIIEKKVNVTCNIDPQVPDDLFGEESRLKQILLNLIDNSIKFSSPLNPSNFVNITVKLLSKSENQKLIASLPSPSLHQTHSRSNSFDQHYQKLPDLTYDSDQSDSGSVSSHDEGSQITIQFSIQDNGIGVPSDKHKYIFDNFFQVDGSYTRTRGGIGLGLSISYMLAQRFGGNMWFESENNKGSTFHFTINIKKLPPMDSDPTNGIQTFSINPHSPSHTIHTSSPFTPRPSSATAALHSSNSTNELILIKQKLQGIAYPTELVNRISSICNPKSITSSTPPTPTTGTTPTLPSFTCFPIPPISSVKYQSNSKLNSSSLPVPQSQSAPASNLSSPKADKFLNPNQSKSVLSSPKSFINSPILFSLNPNFPYPNTSNNKAQKSNYNNNNNNNNNNSSSNLFNHHHHHHHHHHHQSQQHQNISQQQQQQHEEISPSILVSQSMSNMIINNSTGNNSLISSSYGGGGGIQNRKSPNITINVNNIKNNNSLPYLNLQSLQQEPQQISKEILSPKNSPTSDITQHQHHQQQQQLLHLQSPISTSRSITTQQSISPLLSNYKTSSTSGKLMVSPDMSKSTSQHTAGGHFQPLAAVSNNQKVLVAEDNLLNQKLIKTLLCKRGFEVYIANDGKEALKIYEDNIDSPSPFDCILMDIQMPVLNGLEATSAIRNREKREGGHTPIIAVTAHAMKGDKEKFLEAGVDDYVTKPINPKLLYEVIDTQVTLLKASK